VLNTNVAFRAAADKLPGTDKTTPSSPVPDVEDTDNHDGNPDKDQDVFDDTCNDTIPPPSGTPDHTAGTTDNVGTTLVATDVADTSAQPYFDPVARTVTGTPTSAVTRV